MIAELSMKTATFSQHVISRVSFSVYSGFKRLKCSFISSLTCFILWAAFHLLFYQISLHARNHQINPLYSLAAWSLFPTLGRYIVQIRLSGFSGRQRVARCPFVKLIALQRGYISLSLNRSEILGEAPLSVIYTNIHPLKPRPLRKTKRWHNIISHSSCLSSVFVRKWLLSQSREL